MINFSESELTYIYNRCKETTEQLADIDNQDEMIIYYLKNIDKDTIGLANKIVNNADVIKDANTNEGYNKELAEAIYWIDGIWVWVDSGYTLAEEVYKFVECEPMCSIFEKIVEEDNEDENELSGK